MACLWRTASLVEAWPRSNAQTRSAPGGAVDIEGGGCGVDSLAGMEGEFSPQKFLKKLVAQQLAFVNLRAPFPRLGTTDSVFSWHDR